MTMDLRVLQDDYMKEFRKVTREKLLPGALIETNMSRFSGMTRMWIVPE